MIRPNGRYQDNSTRLGATRSRVRTYAALTGGFVAATIVGSLRRRRAPPDRAERVRWMIGGSGVSVQGDF